MSFREQLKKARKALGLTQQQVADEIGVTKSTYCGYETGKREPDVEKIKKLSLVLKTTGDSLLETKFSLPMSVSISIPNQTLEKSTAGIRDLSEDEKKFLKDFRSLNPRGQAAVLSYVEVVSGNPDMLASAPPFAEQKAT